MRLLPKIMHRNRLTPEEYKLLIDDRKRNGISRSRYSTTKITYGEYTFGSPWEFQIYREHYRFKRLRKFSHLKMFPVFALYIGTKVVTHYMALLSYTDNITGLTVVVDARTRATMTKVARLKFKMFRAQYRHELKIMFKPKGWVPDGFKR